ncbi:OLIGOPEPTIDE TRANSPORTER YGL114W-RELATED [Salix purpurea]|uniref:OLIGOPEPTIDE TRANSPORTER YGL114W-RELATED n=1 Tax=Salix purpurea TaxID=77065 RepID=A0A9Q0VHB9_SALPP|nr:OLIGOPEPTIDE TRANSPORTER YGL114W-RELATED [Salix purpurea]
MKLNLTTGLVPNLNVSAALLAFVFLRTWTKLLSKAGIVTSPFTRQENTIVQTCAVACYSIAVGGGFGSYLLGLNRKTYEQAGVDTEGNTPGSTKEPGIGWMTGFLFVSSFVGLLSLVPLRKIMIIDYKLSYPSGTATAVLINGFHTPTGDKMARVHEVLFTKFPVGFLSVVLFWFYFDFSMTYIEDKEQVLDDQKRNEVFLREGIPLWVACLGYITFSIISIIAIPLMFPELKWYYVVVAYILAPSLSFCNAYGAGLTDMNMAYNYGKVALFLLAALAGKNNGVVAGLVGCGLIKAIVSISSDLMHDFKTGHLTLTSPRSMLLSQAIGTVIGCVVAPFTFFLFYKAFDVGNPDGEYKAPYAIIYRNMAILGVEGFSALPQHCLQLCYGFFAFAISANLSRDLSPKNIGKYVPLPMAMAVPFLVGAYFAIDMCLGSLVVFAWHKLNSRKASLMVPAVASGLICGDGLWILPSSILALAKIRPPICMSFQATN